MVKEWNNRLQGHDHQWYNQLDCNGRYHMIRMAEIER